MIRRPCCSAKTRAALSARSPWRAFERPGHCPKPEDLAGDGEEIRLAVGGKVRIQNSQPDTRRADRETHGCSRAPHALGQQSNPRPARAERAAGAYCTGNPRTELRRGLRRRKCLRSEERQTSRTRVIVPAPNVARQSEIRQDFRFSKHSVTWHDFGLDRSQIPPHRLPNVFFPRIKYRMRCTGQTIRKSRRQPSLGRSTVKDTRGLDHGTTVDIISVHRL